MGFDYWSYSNTSNSVTMTDNKAIWCADRPNHEYFAGTEMVLRIFDVAWFPIRSDSISILMINGVDSSKAQSRK